MFRVIKMIKGLEIKKVFSIFVSRTILYMTCFPYISFSVSVEKVVCAHSIQKETDRVKVNGMWASDELEELLRLKTRA